MSRATLAAKAFALLSLYLSFLLFRSIPSAKAGGSVGLAAAGGVVRAGWSWLVMLVVEMPRLVSLARKLCVARIDEIVCASLVSRTDRRPLSAGEEEVGNKHTARTQKAKKTQRGNLMKKVNQQLPKKTIHTKKRHDGARERERIRCRFF